jgi:hypothetical protein
MVVARMLSVRALLLMLMLMLIIVILAACAKDLLHDLEDAQEYACHDDRDLGDGDWQDDLGETMNVSQLLEPARIEISVSRKQPL